MIGTDRLQDAVVEAQAMATTGWACQLTWRMNTVVLCYRLMGRCCTRPAPEGPSAPATSATRRQFQAGPAGVVRAARASLW
jgi:hypothetical protein